MDGSLPELHSNLLGLHVRLTVQCPNHGSHTATMTGPFLEVVDAVHLFRQVSASQDRWVISEYRALDYVPECTVSEWE
jgi:hypothetical protein